MMVAPALGVVSRVDALTRALTRQVLRAEIAPGLAVSERFVCDEFSVARSTARVALERLVASGLLSRAANKSARIPVFDLADARDLYFARELLECEALSSIAEYGHVKDAVRLSFAHFDRRAAVEGIHGALDADMDFHSALIGSTGSSRLARMHARLINECRLFLSQHKMPVGLSLEKIRAERAELLAALEERNVHKVRTLVSAHFSFLWS
ncbi:GntR family transcriptional regulator [Pseudonocardia parietis]|uniref:DNA-binding GntR family transcriptional regulator n=1 Tax=Pseudonocardia parietis TaxID=570936 RepID=A0ABS4W7D4_9PSEU|nr:GntR family transcriptional regulator [Pseudonocardia parietis]MBP2372085.1 DNA-binding GntR family transcriptional regulator [Pseudonocardia parietis]